MKKTIAIIITTSLLVIPLAQADYRLYYNLNTSIPKESANIPPVVDNENEVGDGYYVCNAAYGRDTISGECSDGIFSGIYGTDTITGTCSNNQYNAKYGRDNLSGTCQ